MESYDFKTIEKILFRIENAIHTYTGRMAVTENVIVSAYLLYEAGKQDRPIRFGDIMNGALGIDEDVLRIAGSVLTNESWDVLVRENYSQADLRNVILYVNHEASSRGSVTPQSLVDLAECVLSVCSGEKVADIGCGFGTFITETMRQCPEAETFGYEIEQMAATIASIRAKLLGSRVHIHNCDALTLLTPEGEGIIPPGGFNKIFANLPFGLQARRYLDFPWIQPLVGRCPSLRKAGSADWLFNTVITELLAENGKAVCITANGSLWNTIDKDVRKEFLDEGLIEAVIALPAKMFMMTSIPSSLIVFSRGNKAVRMVDASGMYQAGRRQNTFAAEDLDAIINACLEDTEESRLVSLEEIRDNECNLHPGRYISQIEEIEEGVLFSDIILNVSRGAPATAKELDEMSSTIPTDCQYLSISNIRDGIVDDDLPYLKEIPSKLEKYCVKNETLIISKIGFPFKVGVASVKNDQKILANGNLYIIDLDVNKVDPVYVQAYLESDQGQAQLKAASSGAVMMSIGADMLKNIMLPLPPLEQQKRIRDAYLSAQSDFKIQKKCLEDAQKKLAHVFETELNG